MQRQTQARFVTEKAYADGYRIVDGIIYNPSGEILTGTVEQKSDGYHRRTFHPYKGLTKVMVHQLVAYQKFGNIIFNEGVQVRHLDGDSLNNLEDNIAIGNQSKNMMDKPPEERMRLSMIAATKKRKFDDETVSEIRRLHNEGWTYRQLMTHFNIKSKGTMSHIINHKYKTKV